MCVCLSRWVYLVVFLQVLQVLCLVLTKSSNDLGLLEHIHDLLGLGSQIFHFGQDAFSLVGKLYMIPSVRLFSGLSCLRCCKFTLGCFFGLVELLVEVEHKVDHVGALEQVVLGLEQLFGSVNLPEKKKTLVNVTLSKWPCV